MSDEQINTLFSHFMAKRALPPGAFVVVTTRTRDGLEFHTIGVSTLRPQGINGYVMVRGADAAASDRALVVRDADVVSVVFDVVEPREDDARPPFGFHSRKADPK